MAVGALEDGCGSEDDWEDLDGTQRYRGNVVDGQTGEPRHLVSLTNAILRIRGDDRSTPYVQA